MTPDLAAFSDWTLALLPRLFLYPGGLFLLASLALLLLASGGVRALSPRTLLRDLADANNLPLALAWATVAMLPLPGWTLPFYPGTHALAPLLALSLLLDMKAVRGREQALAGGAVTLALLVPPVEGVPGLVVWAVVGLAVVSAVIALGASNRGTFAGQARSVAWMWVWLSGGLTLLPTGQAWLVPVVLLGGAVALGVVMRLVRGEKGERAASPAIAWSLALPSLLAALLLGP
jgi:hypothetical protein